MFTIDLLKVLQDEIISRLKAFDDIYCTCWRNYNIYNANTFPSLRKSTKSIHIVFVFCKITTNVILYNLQTQSVLVLLVQNWQWDQHLIELNTSLIYLLPLFSIIHYHYIVFISGPSIALFWVFVQMYIVCVPLVVRMYKLWMASLFTSWHIII